VMTHREVSLCLRMDFIDVTLGRHFGPE